MCPPKPAIRIALRRPLAVALILGCSISLLDAGTLTARLALPAAIWWTFVPLLEILALFSASSAARHARPWSQTIDLYFMGHGPVLLWLLALACFFAFVPTAATFSWPARYPVFEDFGIFVLAWSAYLDYCFFRRVLKLGIWQSCRDLFLQRFIAWTIGLTLFVGEAGYQVLATRFGL